MARASLHPANLALRRARRALVGVGGRVLEVGCGQGRFLGALCQGNPPRQGFGCDIDRQALTLARSTGDGHSYLQASLTHLPYAEGSFDVVLIFDVLEHLDDPEAGLAEVARALRPGGLLHALVPCEGQPGTFYWALARLNLAADLKKRHGGHLQRFTQKELLALLKAKGFDRLEVSYSMHPLGQVKDMLTYLAQEDRARRWRISPLLQGLVWGFWPLAYLEAQLLSRVALSAVALHITARKRLR